jgi:hypothetical protein
MEYINIQNNNYYINSIKSNPPLLEIEFNEIIDLANNDLSSIILYTEGGIKCAEFHGYITIYNCDENVIILSNDGSIYVKPDEINIFIPTYEPTADDLTRAEIISLKVKISETDYKIIKCSEYQLVGSELPYDIAQLHTNRQMLRDRINELEAVLNSV